MRRAIHAAEAMLPDGWAREVRVELTDDGAIAAVTPDHPAQPEDARAAILLPGMPNLHSHAFQRGMAGLAEVGAGGDSFWTWREAMYRFVDRMTPDDLLAIGCQAYVEMLETGFTRVGEFHYLHHAPDGARYADPAAMSAAIVAAAQESGIGLTLLPVFYAHAGFGAQPPSAGQRRFVHDLDRFARLLDAARAHAAVLPDAMVGLAPHSLRAVASEELDALAQLGGDAPIHIHVAEQVKEVDDCLAWSGQRPVEWLLDHAPVDARWCAIHATHMTAAETRSLAVSGAVAGLCPITEANLGDGLFSATAFLAAGGAFGVGSDSNVLIDAAEELRLLEYGQRLTQRARNVLAPAGRGSGDFLWSRAVAGGAQALGVAGGIVTGASADLVSLDPAHPSLLAREGAALTDGFVFAAGRGAIDRVWRRGAVVVSGGRHRQREAIAARFAATLRRLLA